MNFPKTIIFLLLITLTAACANRQTIELQQIESLTINTKSHPATLEVDLKINNTMHKEIDILEATAALLPDKELTLTLAEPLNIKPNQDKLKIKLKLDGFNIMQLPSLISTKIINIEMEGLVKIGNKKPMTVKTKMPINTKQIMENVLKNQPHEN